MKLRSFFSILTAGVLVLLLIGASGFFWLTSKSPLTLLKGGSVANPAAAIFVPRQAPVMVSLLVNPDQLEAFRQVIAPPGERRRSRAELNQLKQSLLADKGLDYRRDIQPWLGDEITWAVTTPDIDRNQQNGKQPGYLLVATTKNANTAREFVQLFWQKQAIAGTDLVFEQYKGVKLIYNNQQAASRQKAPTSQNTLATAVVGDRFVVFANHPKVLREAINNVQAPSLSLTDANSYQIALEKLTEPRIGVAYVNLPALAVWQGSQSTTSVTPQEGSQSYESVAIALGLNRQGLLAETSLIAAADKEVPGKAPALSQPVGALQYVPASSSLVAASTNLEQLWNQLSAGVTSDNPLSQLLNQSLASLETAWGIQLPKEVFSWVQGEYALGLLPRPDRQYPDWIFVAEKTATTEESIEHLDAIAKEKGFSVGALPLGNQTVTGWTKLTTAPVAAGQDQSVLKLNAQVQGVHTQAGKYEIFASSVEAIDQALKAPQKSLLASNQFKNAIAPLPQPNDGYFYVDWASTQPILEQQVPIFRVAELVGKPLFANLRSLTISSYGTDTGVQRSKVFFRLGNTANSSQEK